jgi:AcrR family transcriptional regulator
VARAARSTPRTQEERSTETRERLLDATIECLLERGYAGTSTPVVCERTGLSRGALLHHFPTRHSLVIEALRRLVSLMGEETLQHAARSLDQSDPLERMFDVIWANFSQPLFHAALELWMASRTDRELHASLYRAERARGQGIAQLYESLAGAAAKQDGFSDLLQLTLHLMRGMALQRLIRDDDGERLRLYRVWKRMAKSYLDGARPRRTASKREGTR